MAKAFLGEEPGWEQEKKPAEQVTPGPLPDKVDDKRPENLVTERAFFSLFFFLANLGICLGWYAVECDPTGTVNPAWTNFFRR